VVGGHFTAYIIKKQKLDAGYWWPTLFKDTHEFCGSYDNCQIIGGKNQKFWPNW
jgi:hypothetical protein